MLHNTMHARSSRTGALASVSEIVPVMAGSSVLCGWHCATMEHRQGDVCVFITAVTGPTPT